MQVIKYVFQPHGDDRGQLVALEEFKDIPFRIKRVYYMYDTGEGVEMFDFSPDAVLMVLASELYDEADYIRNYDEFRDYVKNCGDTAAAEEV